MPEIETVKVIWPAKFGERVVRINAADFDAAIHQHPATGGPVTITQPKPLTTGQKQRGRH